MPARLSEEEYRRLTGGIALPKKNVKHKYTNKKVAIEGAGLRGETLKFDSGWEANHWFELKVRLAAGEIRNLTRQVTYPFLVNGFKITSFRVDFQYEEKLPPNTWRKVVADCKNPHNRLEKDYRIKFKLMQALYGLTIREVVMPRRRSK